MAKVTLRIFINKTKFDQTIGHFSRWRGKGERRARKIAACLVSTYS